MILRWRVSVLWVLTLPTSNVALQQLFDMQAPTAEWLEQGRLYVGFTGVGIITRWRADYPTTRPPALSWERSSLMWALEKADGTLHTVVEGVCVEVSESLSSTQFLNHS